MESTSVLKFDTKKNGVWYHENDGYYFKQCASKCNKIILKCVGRTCGVKAVIKDDKLVRINQLTHDHEPDFQSACIAEEENSGQMQNKKKNFPKKIQELFKSTKFVGPIEEFSTERRGIWYHQHDGYYYRKYQKHRPKFYLECIQQKCNVTAVMNENLSGSIFIANNRTHNHPPDKDMKAVVLARKAILSRCKSEVTPLKTIYDSEMAKVDDRIRSRIPYAMFRNAMSKNRQTKNHPSIDSRCKFKELICEKMEQLSTNDSEFLSSVSENYAVFILHSTRKLLKDNQLVFCIDSLKYVPKNPAVSQVFVIGAIVNDVLYPVIFVMLMIQAHETYKKVFGAIKREEPLWKPKTVICDSEKTLSEILMHVFPNAVVAGSWFSYNQVILEKSLKSIHHQSICDNAMLREIIRMLMALPLLPANLIKEGLRAVEEHAIKNELHTVPGLTSFFGYLRHQWIFRAGISVYLMSKTILRTLKVPEDFYNHMASYFGLVNNQLDIRTFIDIMKNIEQDFSAKLSSTVKQNSTQQTYRQKIVNARTRLLDENLTILDFLRQMCHLTPSLSSIKEENCEVDVVLVDLNETDCLEEKPDVDAESIELNYDWDYEIIDLGVDTNVLKTENELMDDVMNVEIN